MHTTLGCVSPACVEPECLGLPLTKIFVYIPEAHVDDPIQHPVRYYSNWVELYEHEQLWNMMDPDTQGYNVYDPLVPGWMPANVRGPEYLLPGGFLIYRPWDLRDEHCWGVSALVRELHTSINSHRCVPISVPSRYAE